MHEPTESAEITPEGEILVQAAVENHGEVGEMNQVAATSVSVDPCVQEFARQRRGQLLETLSLIPTFTGQDPSYTLDKFLAKFNNFRNFLHWPDEDALFALQQLLAGQAQTTFTNFRDSITSVDSAFNVLRLNFKVEKDQSQLLAEFWGFMQPKNMGVREYMALAKQKARNLIKAHNFPNDLGEQTEKGWLLSMLLKNLSPNLRRACIARNPTTLQELEEIAVNEEKAINLTGIQGTNFGGADVVCAATAETLGKNNTTQFEAVLNKLEQKIDSLQLELGELKSKEREGTQGIRRETGTQCFYCKEFGHLKRNCPVFLRDSTAHFNRDLQPRHMGGIRNNTGQSANFYGMSSNVNNFANRGGSFNGNRGAMRNDSNQLRGNQFNQRGENFGNRGGNYNTRDSSTFASRGGTFYARGRGQPNTNFQNSNNGNARNLNFQGSY